MTAEQSAEKGAAWRVNGHAIDYLAHRFECLRCGARLMSLMQFQTRECPEARP